MANSAEKRRAAILGRVQAAQGYLPAAEVCTPPASSLEAEGVAAWRTRFIQELEQVDVELHQEETPEAVRARVLALVHELVPNASKADSGLLTWRVLPYDLKFAPTSGPPGDALLGVTGVDGAAAETGSLMLFSSPEQARSASLLPPIHLAMVRTCDLVPNLGAFLRSQGTRLESSSCLNVITGPSRTADIELALTLGVHGPGRVIVVLGP